MYCIIDFQTNNAGEIFSLQDGEMSRSRWKFTQVICRNINDTVHWVKIHDYLHHKVPGNKMQEKEIFL